MSLETILYALVTTPGYIICHDINSAKSEILESGRGNYYGITWDPMRSEIALTHSGIDEQSLVDLATYATSEAGYLTIDGQPTWNFLSAPHQILWVDDVIVITNTGRNALTKLNPRDHSIIQYRYDPALWDRLSLASFDGAHFNSLYKKGNTLYVVAHNHDKGSYILELEWPMLKEKGRKRIRGATGVHNLWIDDTGRFIVCDSNNGTLIDANASEILWNSGSGCYTRGLAATDEIILVGHSENSVRTNRRYSETGIWILDQRDFRALQYHYLGHYGAVQDIRIVDVPDLCHHGKPLSMDALDVLRVRSSQVAKTRLAGIRVVESFVETWRIISGKADMTELGTVAPSDDGLLICTAKKPASGISAKLCWRAGVGTGHAGLVLNYEGPKDENMAAALFEQLNWDSLMASIWINRGEWRMLRKQAVPREAIRSEAGDSREIIQAEFARLGQTLDLRLWDTTVISVAAEDLPPAGQVGIRMLGNLFEFCDIQFRTILDPLTKRNE